MHSHFTTKKLDLKCHRGFSDPDNTENTRENQRGLSPLSDGQEQTQHQAKDQRAPVKQAMPLAHIFQSMAPKSDCGSVPKIPIAQSLAHAALQDHVGIGPASHEPAQVAAKPSSLASLGLAETTAAALHQTPEEVLGVQHLAHLLPHGDQIARQGGPDGLVDSVLGRATVLAGNRGCQVVAIAIGTAAARARVGFNVAA